MSETSQQHTGDLPVDDAARTAQLAQRLSAVRQRILTAAADRPAERAHDGTLPQLIVVTKFFPAEDVVRLRGLGVRAVGENRDQEALPKAARVTELLAEQAPASSAPAWHFVGQLQTNKARRVVRYASWIHSVDRPSLVSALGKAVHSHREAVAAGQVLPGPCASAQLPCCVQVDLDPAAPEDGARGGAHPARVVELAELIAETEGLSPAGVMAVAPLGADPAEAFDRLWEVSRDLVAQFPHATAISAGMSGDLEAAMRAGATHVRVGSDVLGPRPAVR